MSGTRSECEAHQSHGRTVDVECQLRKEVARLQVIVAKPPKTADGVFITVGMCLFYAGRNGVVCYVVESIEDSDEFGWIVKEKRFGGWIVFHSCYSTREAALASK